MSQESLRRDINRYSRKASQCEQQASYFSGLANAARGELSYKRKQLEKARMAKQKCEDVRKVQGTWEKQLDAYGLSLGRALDASDVGYGVSRFSEGMPLLSRNAIQAAQQLIDELHRECAALEASIAQYEYKAASARSSASAYRASERKARSQLS